MIVVSDTSPINYLVLIDCIDLLPRLFTTIVIPQTVVDELNHAHTPEKVRQWVSALPVWASVQSAVSLDTSLRLGRGEREAIALAEQLHADALLMDDWKAWKLAEARGLVVTGTLNVLEAASRRQFIDLTEAFARLQNTTFHVTPNLLRLILDRQPHGLGNTS